MKIISVIGARPQFIKCAPLSYAIRKDHEEIIVHTGQHYDPEMSEIFFKELCIPEPDYNLSIGSASHGEQTGRMLIEIERILLKEKPDLVLVYGDTNSTLSGSLAAAKLQLKTAHVEAGLRSFERTMPEEVNRILTDHVSNLLFCPTDTAVQNLKNEGISKDVYCVGDVMVDSVVNNRVRAEKKSNILSELGLTSKDFMLATIHRPSNTDCMENLSSIVNALCSVDETIVLPVHPRTEKYLRQYGLWGILSKKLKVIPPVSYLDMLKLEANAGKILTDSGGIQKEAYILGVPCITMRENTEWVETVDSGWNVLVGANYEKIIESIKNFCGGTCKNSVFGTGDASEKICEILNTQHLP